MSDDGLPPAAKRFRSVAQQEPRRRKVAIASEVTAPYSKASPLDADVSAYHAFARSPPTALFGKPALWPGPEANATTARLMWNETSLFVCWELEGLARAPVKADALEDSALAALGGGQVQEDQRTVLLDERVECFIWQPSGEVGGSLSRADDARFNGQVYHAFEINFEGRALAFRGVFGGPKDYAWKSAGAFSVRSEELAVGWGDSASPIPTALPGASPAKKRVVIATFKWAALGVDTSREIRVGLHRAEHPATPELPDGLKAHIAEVDAHLQRLVWSSWVDPGDDVVNFHRPSLFGKLVFAPSETTRGSNELLQDSSCVAARLCGPCKLIAMSSPMPSLDECPPGSLLVQAKYASLCGSDLPYFRDPGSKSAGCYWDRDGFCGHEVIGIVLASKSDKFQPGDAALALPSSYFKAHAGSKQEWFKDEVHGVLLQNFPVRGGFSQVYTSHELYSTKMRECVPRMLCAQGLGTILKMARKLGSVLGKSVLVLGQGQNGLIATRLMAQMCARAVIAVDPIENRRKVALTCGATCAVPPEEAARVVEEATGGRGVDLVIEMVGHNQDTINVCMQLVACGGTVAAFGVPDDQIYKTFEYSLFFRKNISLIASVIPDPAVDFPDAVRLIESGQFNTDGILTHTLPLTQVQKAFEMSSAYTDNVIKLVVELG